jgi:integrase
MNAGVEYKGTHAFRHTHAVLSTEAGADLLYLSRRLVGHGTIKTTADTYLDVTPQYESHELEKITNYLNSQKRDQTGIDGAQMGHEHQIQ